MSQLPFSLILYVSSNISLPVSINYYRLNDDYVVILFATYLVYIVRLYSLLQYYTSSTVRHLSKTNATLERTKMKSYTATRE